MKLDRIALLYIIFTLYFINIKAQNSLSYFGGIKNSFLWSKDVNIKTTSTHSLFFGIEKQFLSYFDISASLDLEQMSLNYQTVVEKDIGYTHKFKWFLGAPLLLGWHSGMYNYSSYFIKVGAKAYLKLTPTDDDLSVPNSINWVPQAQIGCNYNFMDDWSLSFAVEYVQWKFIYLEKSKVNINSLGMIAKVNYQL